MRGGGNRTNEALKSQAQTTEPLVQGESKWERKAGKTGSGKSEESEGEMGGLLGDNIA